MHEVTDGSNYRHPGKKDSEVEEQVSKQTGKPETAQAQQKRLNNPKSIRKHGFFNSPTDEGEV